jgi:hypothetical protein
MANSKTLLAKYTFSTNTATAFTVNNLPQTGFNDLKIVMSSRVTNSTDWYDMIITPNGTATNYVSRILYGYGNASATHQSDNSTGITLRTSDTANTGNSFGTSEVYIPNYTSGTLNKVWNSDGWSEQAGLNAIQIFGNGILNSPTTAINSLTFTVIGGQSMVAGTTIAIYGISSSVSNPLKSPKAAGGNIIANDGTYWYHAFLANGTFVPETTLTCDILTVGGGGGGGGYYSGGGGGAGGVLYTQSQSLTSSSLYLATIGGGGYSGGTAPGSNGGNGLNSTLIGGSVNLTALGGGYGGNGGTAPTQQQRAGSTGGSGGGGGGDTNPGAFGTGTAGQGNNGGVGIASSRSYAAGGGGGAGSSGADGSATGNGGSGTNSYSSWLSATNLGVGGYIAAGGGGGSQGSGIFGTGGSGGGGNGSSSVSQSGVNGAGGVANTGSGGGGGGGASVYGGIGGTGLIIIRYTM